MKARTRGSALVVVLVLLSAAGGLALAAAAAAVTALALAGHQQMAQNAFEAAESGIVAALLAAAETRDEGRTEGAVLPDVATAAARWGTETKEAPGVGALPEGFSIGDNDGSFIAKHYFITADGSSARGARTRLEQGFYLVVPAS